MTTSLPFDRWLPCLLLAAFATAATCSLKGDATTFDEAAHVPAGYSYVAFGDYRLNPEHPPFVKLLAGLALEVAGTREPVGPGAKAWRGGDQWAFGYELLYRTPGNDPVRLMSLARLPVLVLGVLLGALVYAFAWDLTGPIGARIALFAFAFCPTMLAHARLVTTDLGAALFYLATVHAAYRVGQRVSLLRVTWLGTALGLALATKFSMLLLLPVLGALGAWRAVDASALEVRFGFPATARRAASSSRKLAVLGLVAVLALGLALVVLWGSYRFSEHRQSTMMLDERVSSVLESHMEARPLLDRGHTLASDLHLLPRPYLDGLVYTLARAEIRSAYLLGERSPTGFPLFFPVAFLVKTPLPVVVLLLPAVAAVLLWGPDRTWGRRCLAVPALVYLGVSLLSPLNIGQRHLAPLYPFTFITLGALAPWVTDWRNWQARACAILAAWYIASFVLISPHYLAYFNELTGGPKHGDRVLVDSNLDWGQDVGRLAKWAQSNAVARLPYAHFGTARPQAYGLRPFVSLPGYSMVPLDDRDEQLTLDDLKGSDTEFLAIHVTNLRGVYLPDRMRVGNRDEPVGPDYYKDFWPLEPVARIGYSINVYRNPWRVVQPR